MNHAQRRVAIGWASSIVLLMAVHNPIQGYNPYISAGSYDKKPWLDRESFGALLEVFAPISTVLWLSICLTVFAAFLWWIYRTNSQGSVSAPSER